jgi:hypothetical protein
LESICIGNPWFGFHNARHVLILWYVYTTSRDLSRFFFDPESSIEFIDFQGSHYELTSVSARLFIGGCREMRRG